MSVAAKTVVGNDEHTRPYYWVIFEIESYTDRETLKNRADEELSRAYNPRLNFQRELKQKIKYKTSSSKTSFFLYVGKRTAWRDFLGFGLGLGSDYGKLCKGLDILRGKGVIIWYKAIEWDAVLREGAISTHQPQIYVNNPLFQRPPQLQPPAAAPQQVLPPPPPPVQAYQNQYQYQYQPQPQPQPPPFMQIQPPYQYLNTGQPAYIAYPEPGPSLVPATPAPTGNTSMIVNPPTGIVALAPGPAPAQEYVGNRVRRRGGSVYPQTVIETIEKVKSWKDGRRW